MLELISPLGRPPLGTQAARTRLESVTGRSVGFIWNQYPATRGFWPHFERAIEALCKPKHVERAYKSNTWMPLETERYAELAKSVDYLIIGVGA